MQGALKDVKRNKECREDEKREGCWGYMEKGFDSTSL